DGSALVDVDAEPVEGPQQVRAGPRAEPSAQFAFGGERDPQARPPVGDLGGALDRGQIAADDQHTALSAQLVQPLSQAQRRGAAGDVEGVLGDARHAVVGDGAAERVDQSVVFEPIVSFVVLDGDGPALGVAGGDARQAQPDAGALEDRRQVVAAQVRSGGELVQAQPLDEVRFGVDDGDLDVVAVETPGEVPGRVG